MEVATKRFRQSLPQYLWTTLCRYVLPEGSDNVFPGGNFTTEAIGFKAQAPGSLFKNFLKQFCRSVQNFIYHSLQHYAVGARSADKDYTNVT